MPAADHLRSIEEIARFQRELANTMGARDDLISIPDMGQRVRMIEAALESVPIGVAVAEVPSGRIIIGNSAMERICRHPIIHSPSADDYGAWVSFHADGRQVDTLEYPLARVIRDGVEEATLDCEYQRGDGTRTWIRLIGRPVHDENGIMIAASVAMIEIAQEHALMEQQSVVIGELNHRMKNMFAVSKSLVSQSLRADGVDAEVVDKIADRLDNYAKAHAYLFMLYDRPALLADLARAVLGGFVEAGRIRLDGPDVVLPERTAVALALALFELSTNAIKYGALSLPEGRVSLAWSQRDDQLNLAWREQGGPEPGTDTTGGRKGFGSRLLDRALTMQTGGTVKIDFGDDGLVWTLDCPLRS